MPVSFPLNLPTSPTAKSITIRKRSVVGVDASPFTLQPQSYTWAGQLWAASVQLPPMARASAEAWVAALVSLNGAEGSFLLGDTANLTPRGSGLAAPIISPTVLNGGFETAGGGGADVFANWTEETGGGTTAIVRDTAIFLGGAASCRMDLDSSATYGAVTQSVTTTGRRYRLSFSARNTAGGTSLVRVQDAVVIYDTTALTSSFASFSVDFTSAASSITLVCYGGASQSVWIDNVTLTPLDGNGVLVNGASQTGYDLATDGWSVSETGVVKAGDWLQLGSGSTARLYKVMADANSNGSGQATLTLWPKLRSSPADNAAVIFYSPMGRFMLAGDIEWSIDEAKVYGLSFDCMEDLRP